MARSIKLTHFGRKSGKRFETRVWFVDIGNDIWIGSQDMQRNWVRNLEASGNAELDFGNGPTPYKAIRSTDTAQFERFHSAIRAKHPIMSRVIAFFMRDTTPGCFRLEPVRDE